MLIRRLKDQLLLIFNWNRPKIKIREYKVCFIPIENDYELYFLEVAIVGILKTYWNNFKTH